MDRNEMVRYIDDALMTYAKDIVWDAHPRCDRFWSMEGAIHYSLIRKTGAKNILECGTELGNATRFLAEAAFYNKGRVTTIELNPEFVSICQKTLSGLPITFIQGDCREIPLDNSYDFIFYDADHSNYMVNWYKENLIPKCKGWFAVHDIDINQNIIDNEPNIEAKEYAKVFEGKYVTARQMYGHTPYRPPKESDDSGWMNGSAYMYFGD